MVKIISKKTPRHARPINNQSQDNPTHPYRSRFPLQITATARSLLLGLTARAAGLVYLEYESANFPTTPGVRPWSIYGSPVRPDNSIDVIRAL